VANKVNSGTVSILFAGCDDPLAADLAVIAPGGGELWLTGTRRTIAWHRGPGVLAVDVALSRDGGATWQTLARAVTDTCWTWNVTGPLTRRARIRIADPAVPAHAAVGDSDFVVMPAALVDAGGAPARGFALCGLEPNPARGRVRVSYELPDAGPARLELVDLAGRRLRSLELRGPGARCMELGDLAGLHPGLYLVRLSRGGLAATRKLIIVR